MQLNIGTQNIIAGALFDFMGHLAQTKTASNKKATVREELDKWAYTRNLSLNNGGVVDWEKSPEATLAALAGGVFDQQARVASALLDFAVFAEAHAEDPLPKVCMRWAMLRDLTISNPQPHWNYQQWA